MAKPTFVSETETAWNTSTSPKTTSSFAVEVGDILVAFGMREHWNAGPEVAVTVSGGGLTWTTQESIAVTDYSSLVMWTAVADTEESITVAFAVASGGGNFGGAVSVWRDSDGIGAAESTNVSSGAPTVNITTTQINSAIIVANADWNVQSGARTWRSGAGTLTETNYLVDAGAYASYGGYHADAGSVGTYAIGLSAPGSQKYSLGGIEVLGSAAAGATPHSPLGLPFHGPFGGPI